MKWATSIKSRLGDVWHAFDDETFEAICNRGIPLWKDNVMTGMPTNAYVCKRCAAQSRRRSLKIVKD